MDTHSKIVVIDHSGFEHIFNNFDREEHHSIDFAPEECEFLPNCVRIISRTWGSSPVCETRTETTFPNPRRVDVCYFERNLEL